MSEYINKQTNENKVQHFTEYNVLWRILHTIILGKKYSVSKMLDKYLEKYWQKNFYIIYSLVTI